MQRWWHPKIMIGLALIVLLAFLTICLVGESFIREHRHDPVIYGVSFSDKYARELGLSPEETLQALLDEVGFRHFRIMSYWDEYERFAGSYDFAFLDWQMNEIARRGGKVTLAIGLKQPRWPECHVPEWADELSSEERHQSLTKYIEIVVRRYQNHPALESYQLENEIGNRFGECKGQKRDQLIEEYQLVKSIDPSHPVSINVNNQIGVPLRYPRGEIVGFSLYKQAYFPLLGRQWPWSYWYISPYWQAARARIIELTRGRSTFVHELQAEPWGKIATADLDLDTQKALMNPQVVQRNVNYALDSGFHTVYLWGGEWWYYQKIKHNDPSMWEAVSKLLEN